MFDNKWQKKEMPLVSLIGMGGGIASPAFLASIVLNILKPTVFSPADDTGAPDFDYTAESSAITNVGTVGVLGGSAFDTTTYTGTSASQKLTTGLDMSDSGGLFWLKGRSHNHDHWLYDSERGSSSHLRIGQYDTTYAATNHGDSYNVDFENDGVTLGSNGSINYTGSTYVGWSFLKTPGFFDVVSWTGDGSGTRDISHSLGSEPAVMIWKKVNTTSDWSVYHKDVGLGHGLYLNSNSDKLDTSLWGTGPTTTNFPAHTAFNTAGEEYVAYLFADNPSNQIKCGTFSNNTGSWGPPAPADAVVDCGFAPQFIIAKQIDELGGWYIMDSERGWSTSGDHQVAYRNAGLQAQETNAEAPQEGNFNFNATSTGFEVTYSRPGTWVFIAIGSPQETVPATQLTLTDTTVSKISDGSLIEGESIDQVLTVGETVQADTAVTSTVNATVFSTTLYQSGSGNEKTITTGIDNTDKSLVWIKGTTLGYHHKLMDSERGSSYPALSSDTSNPETGDAGIKELTSNGFVLHGNGYDKTNDDKNTSYVAWNFRAAPGFFDVVTWTGDASGAGSRTLSHSLNGTVGTVIVKCTSDSSDWMVWHKSLSGGYLNLNETRVTQGGPSNTYVSSTNSDFTITYDGSYFNYWNGSGRTYVAYVFADDTPGLIKCGSYSSSGEVVNLGFRPQWLMIKSTDNSSGFTGDWRIFDTTRGIVDGDGDVNLWANEPRAHITGSFESAIDLNENGFTVEGQGAYGTSTIYIAIAENAEADIPRDIYATGEVSASTGNTITLSDTSGTWSTGMKVQGVTTDTKDYPDPIKVEDVSLTSSAPTAERNVNTWGDAVWEIATDENFTQNVQTATSALSATGTQAGPSFTFEPETGYYARTKYTALGQESEWSDVTHFLTEGLPVHWITTISDPNGINLGQQSSLVTDSQNNVLVTTVTSQNHHNLVKFDPQGNISWQRKYSKSGVNFYYQFGQNCIDVDSNDNTFIGVMSDAPGGTDMITAKYSNSGTLEWQRKINFSNDRTEAVATDSSGSVFNVGYTESHQQMGNGSGYTINVTKHDSSGNHLFTRAYGDNDDRGYYADDAHVDSSGNLLFVGHFQHSSGTNYPYLQKVNGTDGSIIFGKTLGSGYHANTTSGVTTDSSGNIYVAWKARDVNNVYGILFAKYNSSGTLQWKKEIYDAHNKSVSAVDVDSSDNIYIWGDSDTPNASQGAAGLLIKMDSSGSMVWQRLISGPNTINHGGMSVDTADNIAICGQVYPASGGNASIFVGKVPSDGSLMGTYNTPFGTYVYAEASNSVRDATSRTSADYTFPRSPLQTGGFTNNENHDSDVNNLTSSPTLLE